MAKSKKAACAAECGAAAPAKVTKKRGGKKKAGAKKRKGAKKGGRKSKK
jgi:hypothetical protein